MKKIMTLALCAAAVGSLSAQKINVDNAKKLAGKVDKIEEARHLIREAMQDPSTAEQANTYYVAGKIEFDAFDKGLQAAAINPEAPAANPDLMASELFNGYEYFLKALPLDQIPNEKGEIKPKVTKDILGKLAGHTNDFFTVGAKMYEEKKFYPESYQGFIIYADMPDQEFFGGKGPQLDPANRAQAYFNAGIAAYSGNEVLKAAQAFSRAREMGSEDPNAFIYEIASWQAVMQRDSTMADTAQEKIFEVAQAGNEKFGLEQPVFLNNLVNAYVMHNDFEKALATVNNLIATNPDKASLYGLRGFIYDRADNDEASLADYRKAASIADCDYETLKNTAKKLYRVASVKYGALDPSDKAGKQALRTEYYDPAMEIAKRAKALQPSDPDVDTVIDAIDYAITTYYN